MSKIEQASMNWAEKINEILHVKKLTQKDLAKIGGCTQSTISKYCKGQRIPSVEFAKALFDKLDIDPRWFFSEEVKREIPGKEKQ